MNMETPNEEANDITVESLIQRGRGRPAKPKEPKEPKPPKHSLYLDNPKEWFKEYYVNKILKPCECSTCGTKFVSVYSLTRHEGRSNKCKVLKLTKIISEMDSVKENNNIENIVLKMT